MFTKKISPLVLVISLAFSAVAAANNRIGVAKLRINGKEAMYPIRPGFETQISLPKVDITDAAIVWGDTNLVCFFWSATDFVSEALMGFYRELEWEWEGLFKEAETLYCYIHEDYEHVVFVEDMYGNHRLLDTNQNEDEYYVAIKDLRKSPLNVRRAALISAEHAVTDYECRFQSRLQSEPFRHEDPLLTPFAGAIWLHCYLNSVNFYV